MIHITLVLFAILAIVSIFVWWFLSGNKTTRSAFIFGCGFATCLMAIIQDTMGKDWYMEYLKHSWVNANAFTWTYFILGAVLFLAAARWLGRKFNNKESQ